MRQQIDVIRSFRPGVIHGLLYCGIQRFTVFILHKVIDIVSVFVLKELRRGSGQRCGGGDAYKSDPHSRGFPDQIGGEDRLPVFAYVAGKIGEIRFLRQFQEPVRSVIEFMISWNGNVIPHRVHQPDHRFALGDGAHDFALNRVTVVDQKGGITQCFQGFAHLLYADEAKACLHPAVDIAGIQDHDIPVFFHRSSFRR